MSKRLAIAAKALSHPIEKWAKVISVANPVGDEVAQVVTPLEPVPDQITQIVASCRSIEQKVAKVIAPLKPILAKIAQIIARDRNRQALSARSRSVTVALHLCVQDLHDQRGDESRCRTNK